MSRRENAVTMRGKPLTLLGPELKVGQAAPDAVLVDNDLAEVRLSAFRGKVCVISVVPSLDTPTCDRQTRRFNEEAAALGDDVTVLTVSMDLPFAQKRWCGAAGVLRVKTLSDYRYGSFGQNYGVLIEHLRLLARTLFVVDRQGRITYVQRVRELSEEPDYAPVLAAAREALRG